MDKLLINQLRDVTNIKSFFGNISKRIQEHLNKNYPTSHLCVAGNPSIVEGDETYSLEYMVKESRLGVVVEKDVISGVDSWFFCSLELPSRKILMLSEEIDNIDNFNIEKIIDYCFEQLKLNALKY